MISEDELQSIRQRLVALRLEHGDLEAAITALAERPFVDELQLRRMKKRKLQIKDFIARLESSIIPDLDA